MNKTILGIVIATAFFAGTILTGTIAFADDDDNKKKNKIKPTLVTSNLLIGQVTCLDSSQHTIEGRLNFDKKATSSVGLLQGGNFHDPVITGNLINFGFSSAKIKENSFEAIAVFSENSLCGGFAPGVITFSGECGPGSTINFATDSGMIGTVTGNIACA